MYIYTLVDSTSRVPSRIYRNPDPPSPIYQERPNTSITMIGKITTDSLATCFATTMRFTVFGAQRQIKITMHRQKLKKRISKTCITIVH